MVLVFSNDSIPRIWMKGMNFPIDIVFIDAKGRISGVETAYPDNPPHRVYTPGEPAKYVVEVRAGFCDSNNVSAGDRVRFDFGVPR